MVRHYLYIIPFVALLLASGGCTRGEEGEEPGQEWVNDGMIFAAGQDILRAEGMDGEDSEADNSAPIIYGSFQNGDLLYFSQMPQGVNPNFEDQSESASNYLYIYSCSPNDQATWAEGYNFKVVEGRRSFNWDNVLSVGPSGNAFKFFGFFFPGEEQTVRWNVEQDQTGSANPYDTDNFVKSDIMGAFHATSAIYTRMRFRLFHLMTYLMVKVYVPVFNGTADDYNNQSYSGFNENAMQGGYVLNAYTDFKIEWAASKSSDTDPPLVQADDTKSKSHIKMYRHDLDESQISTVYVPDYYGQEVDGITDNQDRVRTYQFSVLFPTQAFDGDFICFALTTPGGDTKYYYFRAEQIIGSDGTSFGLTQGTLQELNLYLPRKTNQTVLVGAKILPWKDSETEMTVNKQEK